MLGRSLGNLENQDFGYETRGRVLVALNRPPATYTAERLTALNRDLEERRIDLANPRPPKHLTSSVCSRGPPPPRAYQSMRATARPCRSWSPSASATSGGGHPRRGFVPADLDLSERQPVRLALTHLRADRQLASQWILRHTIRRKGGCDGEGVAHRQPFTRTRSSRGGRPPGWKAPTPRGRLASPSRIRTTLRWSERPGMRGRSGPA